MKIKCDFCKKKLSEGEITDNDMIICKECINKRNLKKCPNCNTHYMLNPKVILCENCRMISIFK